jgi:hypothetical protein
MTDFFGGDGVFIGAAPIRPASGKDLGEYASGGTSLGHVPGDGAQLFPTNTTVGNFWGRSSGVISPLLLGDRVAIGAYGITYDEKLSVAGKILSTGFMLSDTVYITKDNSDNLVFTDAVSGSKTLAELLTLGGGDVKLSGTPTNLQLAQWINATTIQGIAISSLTLTQSQITGLVTALANKAARVHNLVDTVYHPVTGLTPGHFLKALTPTTYGFAAHGLTATDVGLGNVTNNAQVKIKCCC